MVAARLISGTVWTGILGVGSLWGAAVSAPCDVFNADVSSQLWTTLHVSPVVLPVNRPAGTARTVFEAVNLEGETVVSQVVPAGDDTVVWTPFSGAAPETDEHYTLRLAYSAAGDDRPFANDTAGVAVLRGAFGAGIEVRTSTNASCWAGTGLRGVVGYGGQWFSYLFRFPPWRADRPGRITVTADGTNVVSGPLTFKAEAYRVFAE